MIFLTGKNSKIYREIDDQLDEQTKIIRNFKDNSLKPTNNIWIAYFANIIGKLAKAVENNDDKVLEVLIVKFIAQLIAWLDLIRDRALHEVDLKTKEVHNPSFNTILVKLTGDLSKLVLLNKNSAICDKIAVINSYTKQWLLRLTSSGVKIIDYSTSNEINDLMSKYFDAKEKSQADLEEILSEIELDI